VGHSVHKDILALGLGSSVEYVIDTSLLFSWDTKSEQCTPKLKDLMSILLHQQIQQGVHDPVEDAWAALSLVEYELAFGPTRPLPLHRRPLPTYSSYRRSADGVGSQFLQEFSPVDDTSLYPVEVHVRSSLDHDDRRPPRALSSSSGVCVNRQFISVPKRFGGQNCYF